MGNNHSSKSQPAVLTTIEESPTRVSLGTVSGSPEEDLPKKNKEGEGNAASVSPYDLLPCDVEARQLPEVSKQYFAPPKAVEDEIQLVKMGFYEVLTLGDYTVFKGEKVFFPRRRIRVPVKPNLS